LWVKGYAVNDLRAKKEGFDREIFSEKLGKRKAFWYGGEESAERPHHF